MNSSNKETILLIVALICITIITIAPMLVAHH